MTSVAKGPLIELAAKRGRHGIEAPEAAQVVGKKVEYVRQTLSDMAREGKLHKVQIHYRKVRYFDTKANADRFERALQQLPRAKSVPAAAAPDLPVITPAGVKVTKCPSPLPPFQPAPSMAAPVRAGSMDFRKHQKPGRY